MKAKNSIIPVFVPHLGCPHMCVFCNQRRISGAAKPAGAEDVHRAIVDGLSRLPEGSRPTLAFYGGSFTAIPAREQEELLGAALPFLRDGKIASVRLSTRPDCIDEEILERLKKYGVRTVELGVQSMDADVLGKSKRGHTAEDARKASRLIRNAGFELILQMMTGLPGDSPEKSVKTAQELIALRPDGVRIYPTVVIRDTELYDMYLSGEYREHTVEEAVELCAVLSDMFEKAGIPIIRMGLNPTEELSGGAAAAGAYHPAFGELTEGRRYLKKERALLSEADRGKSVIFGVSRGCVSCAVGQKRKNAEELKAEFGLRELKIKEADVKKGEVVRIS